jgi:hypothetical protein
LFFFKSIKVKYCTINPFLRDCTRSSVCNLEGKTIRSNKRMGSLVLFSEDSFLKHKKSW